LDDHVDLQDSLTCINYGYPYRAHPGSECPLLDFVSPDHQSTPIPCHHIPLNSDGKTIEDLEGEGNQPDMEETLKRLVADEDQRVRATGREPDDRSVTDPNGGSS